MLFTIHKKNGKNVYKAEEEFADIVIESTDKLTKEDVDSIFQHAFAKNTTCKGEVTIGEKKATFTYKKKSLWN